MSEVVKGKKELKAERKAAAMAKQEAIANGTWVEQNTPKAKVVDDESEEIVVDGREHLLHVYSSQAGCMAQWIKHAHKPEGTEILFYSFNALQPLIKTVNTVEYKKLEYDRLCVVQKSHRDMLANRRTLAKGYNWFTKIVNKTDYQFVLDDIIHLEHQMVRNEKQRSGLIERMFSFCSEVNKYKDML